MEETKHYSLEEIVSIFPEAENKGFTSHPMIIEQHGQAIEVFVQDVSVEQGHLINDKFYETHLELPERDNPILTDKATGAKLPFDKAIPYYHLLIIALKNEKFLPEEQISTRLTISRKCTGKAGCYFDWSKVSCINHNIQIT